jgi:UDP-N-acetylmuramate dehydrogenase
MNLQVQTDIKLAPYVTLKAGGNADRFVVVRNADELAAATTLAFENGWQTTILGWGSNMLPSDQGVSGLCILNLAKATQWTGGEVVAESGVGLQDLFLQSAQRARGGLEFAVGIPGTLGGALVSNAGAYRNNISANITEVELVWDGVRAWHDPAVLEFKYRDSILRQANPPHCVVTQVRLVLPSREAKEIYDDARDYQRQRIGKQPPQASAGSFFKNVESHDLAQRIEGLTDGMRQNGVVPAGFLIEACGLKGKEFQGAQIGKRHANFLLNAGGATASSLRRLSEFASAQVLARFGVQLEEEVLYLGRWDGWQTTGTLVNL